MQRQNTSIEEIRKHAAIVGSGPARKPLPYGTNAEKREAIERAIRLIERWGGGGSDAIEATLFAWESQPRPEFGAYPAGWLPRELRQVAMHGLRELLRGMPPRAER